ncbi:MAG: NAD(P)-dependent glycerol-3-phosphate dehydrogenase [Oscillospiraceae bacterium]|jgi:glycerol-3-phosphate dehydrogenase (NAD(P)+)|nr:NAD(P)-dependent glycerol-3-phosphate dehydrogenase [Oscillospiraceae bacterium]
MRISVLGSGIWGTALAKLLADNAHDVTLHFLRTPHSAYVSAERESKALPGVRLPTSLKLCDSLDGLDEAQLVVFAPPSYAMRENAALVKRVVPRSATIVSVSKGIERDSGLRLSQVLESELGDSARIAVLSGPSHAEEIARGIPTGCVAAAVEPATAKLVQDAFMSPDFRVYTSDDVVGVELCGALKNIIAIAVGVCGGLGYGDNTKAMLMTRGLFEMSVLGETLGGRRETFAGLAGVGDLIVTCTSEHSRNLRMGRNVGQGMTAQDAMHSVGATVEGYYAAEAAVELSRRHGVEMPIVSELYGIMYHNADPRAATVRLMRRDKKDEI